MKLPLFFKCEKRIPLNQKERKKEEKEKNWLSFQHNYDYEKSRYDILFQIKDGNDIGSTIQLDNGWPAQHRVGYKIYISLNNVNYYLYNIPLIKVFSTK